MTPELRALGQILAGEFDNSAQALAEPAWYVHLRLWLRPVPLFAEADSLALFAEQANALTLERPYRQRLLRLRAGEDRRLRVEFYQFRDPVAWRGAARDRQRLATLTAAAVDRLDCTLPIAVTGDRPETWQFRTVAPPDYRCCFRYQGQDYTVFLGFAASASELLTYDKGIDPATGQATWGALLGPYRFARQQRFAAELPTASR